MQSIIDKLEKNYTLLYADYRECLDEQPELIQRMLDAKSLDELYDKYEEWDLYYAEMKSINYIIDNLDLTEEEEEWIEDFDNRNIIEEEIRNRDDSTYFEDVLKNTMPMPIRLSLHSNYDCMNSDYAMSPYVYDGYFKDMLDALNLNPAKVKEVLGDNASDEIEYPDMPERNGNEYISYNDLYSELNDSCGSCNLLTFVGLLDPSDIKYKEGEYTVTIPKGNSCGLFDKDTGSGSLIECTLLRDFTVTLSTPIEGKSQYDNYELCIDEANGYSIDDVYGPTREFFGNTITIS